MPCLNALQQQSYTGQYDITLVDSSDDKTPEIVSSDYPNVKLIHLEKRTDPGTARNIGTGEAKGDLIAFVDSDCVPAHDWLERIVCAHDSKYAIIGGVVKNGNDGNDRVGCAGYISEFREFLPEQPKREVRHIPHMQYIVQEEDLPGIWAVSRGILPARRPGIQLQAVETW